MRKGALYTLDANDLAVRLFADSIASNMFMLGYAYQLGRVPVSADAIEKAIELNGAGDRDEPLGVPFRPSRRPRHEGDRADREAAQSRRWRRTLAEMVATRVKYLDRLPGRGAGQALQRHDRPDREG